MSKVLFHICLLKSLRSQRILMTQIAENTCRKRKSKIMPEMKQRVFNKTRPFRSGESSGWSFCAEMSILLFTANKAT